jgi:anti-sigma regulatory factor (Ser/Thr protein kinase)
VTDAIRLVLPAQEDFRGVAHLVVGGLGARVDLTLEDLEDLQVAVEALLGCRDDDDDVTVSVELDTGLVRASVGPFPAEAIAQLDQHGGGLGLRRVLETVSDGFEVTRRPDGSWVELRKETTGTAA